LGGERGPGVLSAHHRPGKTIEEFPGGKEYIIPSGDPGRDSLPRPRCSETFPIRPRPSPGDCHTLFFPRARSCASGRPPGPGPEHAGHFESLDASPDQTTGGCLSERSISRLARLILERCQHTHGEIAADWDCELPTTKTSWPLIWYYQRNIVSDFIPI